MRFFSLFSRKREKLDDGCGIVREQEPTTRNTPVGTGQFMTLPTGLVESMHSINCTLAAQLTDARNDLAVSQFSNEGIKEENRRLKGEIETLQRELQSEQILNQGRNQRILELEQQDGMSFAKGLEDQDRLRKLQRELDDLKQKNVEDQQLLTQLREKRDGQ